MASEEPSDCVIELDGEVRVANDDGKPEVVGWISARVVQAGRAYNDSQSLFEVCDCIDQSLYDYASAVYDYDNDSIKDSISDGCGGTDILIVQSIQIVRAHRGKRLGLLAMRRTIDTFGCGCAVVVIKPFPLQFSVSEGGTSPVQLEIDARMAMNSFTASKKTAFAKLRNYWRKLGFRRIGDTEYLALDLQRKQPSYEKLLR